MKTRASALLFVLLVCGFIPAAFAQLSGGSLSGTVTDPSGAAVGGATVAVTHVTTGRQLQTVTTDAGLYAFPNLDVGGYTLTVEKPGFKRLSRGNIVIAISTQTALNVA